MTDWTQIPDPEFTAEYLAINAEMGRRRVLEAGPAAQDKLNAATLEAEGISEGEPWRQPAGGHDAYPEGWQVTHNGKSWVSLMAGNVWEPGVSGWREEGNDWPAWVQPTGGHDAYEVGAQVSHPEGGQHWTNTTPDNVWEPGVHGWDMVA